MVEITVKDQIREEHADDLHAANLAPGQLVEQLPRGEHGEDDEEDAVEEGDDEARRGRHEALGGGRVRQVLERVRRGNNQDEREEDGDDERDREDGAQGREGENAAPDAREAAGGLGVKLAAQGRVRARAQVHVVFVDGGGSVIVVRQRLLVTVLAVLVHGHLDVGPRGRERSVRQWRQLIVVAVQSHRRLALVLRAAGRHGAAWARLDSATAEAIGSEGRGGAEAGGVLVLCLQMAWRCTQWSDTVPIQM